MDDGCLHLVSVPFQVRTGAKAHPSNYEVGPDVRGKWCVGAFGTIGMPESRNTNKRSGFAIERGVIVGSPNARLSRFVAAAGGVARDYDSDITVGYGGREADARRVLETIMVLGEARRGEEIFVRAEGEDAGEAMDALARFLEGEED